MARVVPHSSAAGVDTSIPPEERYQILGRIASGGMAEIYVARMRTSGGAEREVVLKRLMPELQSDHEFVQMFYDEANIAQQLRHPNIVHIYELGELDGSLFISMELLRGVNLRDLLARLHIEGRHLPVPIGMRIAASALDALEYAHAFTDASGRRLNVVHRDVSPQNIIVTYDGVVKLVDFGVAKAEGRLHQTRAGLIKGKFAYMSPEQVSGGKVDGRSDLFALAEVFYELQFKRHPFYAASDMEVLRAILDKDPPHPCSIDQQFPSAVGEALIRAMRKTPGDRFASAGQMQDVLERWLQESRSGVTTESVGEFLRELFDDRVALERTARERGDDDSLIEALTAGRAEELIEAQQRGRQRARAEAPPPAAPVAPDRGAHPAPATHSGVRDQVVEIARGASGPHDPAEHGAPAFIAHSGYTNPGTSRARFQSQVRQLFEEPSQDAPAAPEPERHRTTDDGEMPTMLGTLSAEELAEIRGTKAAARGRYSPGITVRPPRATREDDVRVGPADPSARQQPRITASSHRAPVATPAPSPAVTPRSRTVVPPDAGVAPKTDRVGLIFFIAGLGALVGAVIYAVWLYTSANSGLGEIRLNTQPQGALIQIDGRDTGQRTPSALVPNGTKHQIRFLLEGHQPCDVEVATAEGAREEIRCSLVAIPK